MSVRGRTDEEIEEYFAHITKIDQEESPIIIISGVEEDIASRGIVTVAYGITAPASAGFNKNDKFPGSRDVTIPIYAMQGFSVHHAFGSRSQGGVEVFAKKRTDSSTEEPIVNTEHPFDKVHFADSAEQVKETIEAVVPADMKSIADHRVVDAINLPTMVAYGEDAVVELSSRISAISSRYMILARRSIEGIGIDTPNILGNLSNMRLAERHRRNFAFDFEQALKDYLEHGPDDGEIDERLAFLGPLQEAVEYHPAFVLNDVSASIVGVYSASKGHVVTEKYSSADAVRREVADKVKALEEFEIKATEQGMEGRSVRHGAADARAEEILEKALSETPKRKLLVRHGIKRALDSIY